MDTSGVAMPNRERFRSICLGERPGDFMVMDWVHRCWAETIEGWIEQGAPEEIRRPEMLNEYFRFDHLHGLQEIVSEHNRADLKELASSTQTMGFYHITPPVVPVFEIKVLSEDERHRVETTYGGATVEVSKAHPWRMPRFIDHPVKDRASWNEYRKRLDPHTPERWPRDWEAFCADRNRRDDPTMLLLEGYFGVLREWVGVERLLFMFYDDPGLVEDMMDQVLYLSMEVAKRVVKDLRIDVVRFWEDMAFKSGTLISPDMIRKYMLPRYRQITDFLHSHGIDILHADSDGNIDELIPLWLEVGVNFPWPLEVAAGMDAVALRKKYGKDIILGGNIDKRVFARGKDAIKQEVMSKVPYLVETGPYFPCLDHVVPPDISLDGFRYYIDLLQEIGGREKIAW
ncbi:MAG: uroporphyrinogen decarboxylase family protein [Dehalococcoidales bacterium]